MISPVAGSRPPQKLSGHVGDQGFALGATGDDDLPGEAPQVAHGPSSTMTRPATAEVTQSSVEP